MPNFPGTIKSKLPKVGTTIFTTMSALAQQHNAINLSQGFPDFEVSKKLKSLVNQYVETGNNQYAPMAGVMKLREQIAKKIEKLYGTAYNPETEITVTPGGTMALYSAISAVVNDGDEFHALLRFIHPCCNLKWRHAHLYSAEGTRLPHSVGYGAQVY
jgi:methionine transaminase